MDIFRLFRNLFDYAFENPDKIKPAHIALFTFAVEHCNRLGWKEKFGFPTSLAMEAVGIKSFNTYNKTLNDLIDFGFIIMIQKSKNQYTSNIISLVNRERNQKRNLDKAISKNETTVNFEVPEFNENYFNDFSKNENIKESEFFIKTSSFFSQTTENQKMKMFGDLVRLKNNNLLEDFTNQTLAYMDYKNFSNEKFHRWQNYIYDWQSENWVDKLLKAKTNGDNHRKNTPSSISGRTSKLTPEDFTRNTESDSPFD